MKHLKLFENFSDIDAICKRYGIENYTINSDGTIDVNGNVNLYGKGLTKLPLRFGKVTGDFDCILNELTTLKGSPKEVVGDFSCNDNKLITLEGGPIEVGGDFICSHNKLVNLRGCTNKIVGSLYCTNNKLVSLEGSPKHIGLHFFCSDNQLKSLVGGPKYIGKSGLGHYYCENNKLISLDGYPIELGYFHCNDNPIHVIYKLFSSYKEYQDSMDYNYLRGTNIVKSRFEEALEEIGKTVPEKIKGYNYI